MVVVRSSATLSLMAGGMEACSVGRIFRTLSTAAMTLAPGDLKTMIRIAGLPLTRPPVWMSSTESVTSATSGDADDAVSRGCSRRQRRWRSETAAGLVRRQRCCERCRQAGVAAVARLTGPRSVATISGA